MTVSSCGLPGFLTLSPPSVKLGQAQMTPILSNECLVAAYLDAVDTLTCARELAEQHAAAVRS